jgi:Spy/CpxP family protein refolding chaperone
MKPNYIPAGKLLLAGAIALLSVAAQAQPMGNPDLDDEVNLVMAFYGPPPMPPMPPGLCPGEPMPGLAMAGGMPLPPMVNDLQLTEVQSDKVFAILYALEPQLREQSKAIRKMEDALRGFVFSDRYDEARLKPLVDAGAKAIETVIELKARADHQIFALLTPEQRRQVAARNAEQRSDRRHRPGRQELPPG